MAMKKAEMEAHRAKYNALIVRARAALREGRFHDAIEAAISTWDYIDGMMQYERRYQDREFTGIDSIDMALRYAPLVFDYESLNELDSLLKSKRRIDKNTSDDLVGKLAGARALMLEAHLIWDHLEKVPDARQDRIRKILGGNQDRWRSVVETWEKMGLVRRTPEGGSYRLSLVTRMDQVVRAKCPSCGAVAKAKKSRFLENQVCPQCRTTASFVILAEAAGKRTEE